MPACLPVPCMHMHGCVATLQVSPHPSAQNPHTQNTAAETHDIGDAIEAVAKTRIGTGRSTFTLGDIDRLLDKIVRYVCVIICVCDVMKS